MAVWAEPFTPLRLAKLFNLRTDPYEFADITSNTYYDWVLYNAYFIYRRRPARRSSRKRSRSFRPCRSRTPSRSTMRWRR